MLYEEAIKKLNEMERLEIAKAVYNGKKSEFARSPEGLALHNELAALDKQEQYDRWEEYESDLNDKILEDNFFMNDKTY